MRQPSNHRVNLSIDLLTNAPSDSDRQTTALILVFGLLLAITLGGIIYHRITKYDYPASPSMAFELNVLGDLYEAFFLVPIGLIGLWLLRRGSAWGPVIIAGVAANLLYNYVMASTGRQNLWIFLWIAKIAFSGAAVCLVWRFLPVGSASAGTIERLSWQNAVIGMYLTLVLLVFSKMMGQRLLASAMGRAVDMTMREVGPIDWGEPVLRDPVVFFSFVAPVIFTAILGLFLRVPWGAKAASMSCAFILSIVTIILFTGPLKEYLQAKTLSSSMMAMSTIMVIAAIPALWAVIWLTKLGKYPK